MIRETIILLTFGLTFGVSNVSGSVNFKAGPLEMEVHISRTAHIFHVVDNLSMWSYYCHPEYREGMGPMSKEDLEALDEHKAIRSAHSWGMGLEQAFYTPLELEKAIEFALEQELLTPEEAVIEQRVFSQFYSRVEELLENDGGRLEKFADRLPEMLPILREKSKQLERFTGIKPDPIAVFLLLTPSDYYFGGGFNGARVTLEIPTEADPFPTLLHEIFHAFLKPHQPKLDAAVESVHGLDGQTLKEGIAYALSPGIIHDGPESSDPLFRKVQESYSLGKNLNDPHTRVHRFALMLRPILREALESDDQTIESILPRVLDVWRGLAEIDPAIGCQ